MVSWVSAMWVAAPHVASRGKLDGLVVAFMESSRCPTFDSLCLFIARSLWLERNARVIRNQSRLADVLADAMACLGEHWCRAQVVRALGRVELSSSVG
jgi:hypothetical protein